MFLDNLLSQQLSSEVFLTVDQTQVDLIKINRENNKYMVIYYIMFTSNNGTDKDYFFKYFFIQVVTWNHVPNLTFILSTHASDIF